MHILQLLRMKDQRGWLIAGVACVSPRSPERPESHRTAVHATVAELVADLPHSAG